MRGFSTSISRSFGFGKEQLRNWLKLENCNEADSRLRRWVVRWREICTSWLQGILTARTDVYVGYSTLGATSPHLIKDLSARALNTGAAASQPARQTAWEPNATRPDQTRLDAKARLISVISSSVLLIVITTSVCTLSATLLARRSLSSREGTHYTQY